MKKKYKQPFKSKGGFFSSVDEIVEKTQSKNEVSSQPQFKTHTNHSDSESSQKFNSKTFTTNSYNKHPSSSYHQKDKTYTNTDKNHIKPKSQPIKRPNFAFIDGQNLNKSIQNQGWSLDYKEFRNYLDREYGVKKAYMFIGMVNTNQQLYSALQDFGYHLVFKPTLASKQGEIKGNVDAEMVLYALTQINQYDQAVIVSGDGDFYTLVQYLKSQGKLKTLLVPNEKAYSNLYDSLDIKTDFVDDLRKKLEYKKK
ncbi:MAG: hypothetical protein RLZZ223_200 [Candidatus Parcubacteria bacterium]|jgi:uncharacterized LabA/DUF88 family protein